MATSGPGKPDERRGRRLDLALVLLLATAAAIAAYHGSRGLDALVRAEHWDLWFDADCPRVLDTATDPRGVHLRTGAHPLFELWAYPPVALLHRVGGLGQVQAVRLLQALTASACMAAFYALLRTIGCRRLDSVVFSLLAAVSAAAMFWFVVPTPYPAGLLTILLALLLVAWSEGRRTSPAWDVLINIATLSFTSTNWMAGLLATFARWPVRLALRLALAGACFTATLMVVQHWLFPSTPIWSVSFDETRYIFAGGVLRVPAAFIFHSLIMPAITLITRDGHATLTVQAVWPGSAGIWGIAAAVQWLALLGLGVWGMWSHAHHRRLRIVLGLTLAGQLLLHCLYGRETFLYACHFGPLLVVVAAGAVLSPARRIALLLAVGLLVCAGVNNTQQFRHACELVEAQQTEHRPHTQAGASPEGRDAGLANSIGQIPRCCPASTATGEADDERINVERIQQAILVAVRQHRIAIGVRGVITLERRILVGAR